MVDIPQTNYKLEVTVKSPVSLVYQGQAVAMTLMNENGKFDILPMHENFISLVKDSIIIYETPDKQKEIKIEEGIAKVFENTVDIFIGIKPIA